MLGGVLEANGHVLEHAGQPHARTGVVSAHIPECLGAPPPPPPPSPPQTQPRRHRRRTPVCAECGASTWETHVCDSGVRR